MGARIRKIARLIDSLIFGEPRPAPRQQPQTASITYYPSRKKR